MILDVISALCIIGAALLSLAAGIGALRFPDLLSRMHAASKPQLFGLVLVMFAVGLQTLHWGPISTMILIVLFQLFTVPVAAHMIGRAGYRTKHLRRSMLYRDELDDAVARAHARDVAERERAAAESASAAGEQDAAADRTTHHDDEPDAGR
ncbi:MAG TPA: monovalent cation/H(+) antiporter subunit G [Brevibacterium senegalense]|uniref:Monovalent cation/H(+) antiporter subunit G n=1 Tax=Brevibacterium senegalense TaxID=1033736 RepID=A0A921MFX2_9MICO|nr:monovalent cation/H(+) antiporter subunit G [Candidatus Brevibacterium intestinigallinarum]HJG81484.1 monovalent cation/H(+) antiporter subunit G [Brevibacterium senegalense]